MNDLQWTAILRTAGVTNSMAVIWAPFFAQICKPEMFSMGDEEIDDFVSQILHESKMLTRLEEDLRYSALRMTQVWPSRFPTVQSALPYQYNPEALANKVYGGRLGNTEPGDGWLYRGSGPIMITGKGNFQALQNITGIPLVKHPDLLRTPGVVPLEICRRWWEGHVADNIMGDTAKVCRAVNGGDIGMKERIALTHSVSSAMDTVGRTA